MNSAPTIAPIDLGNSAHAAALLALLDHYAADPLGGGEGLSSDTLANLIPALRGVPNYHGALAMFGDEAVGLINCFTAFSTFAARPLLNIHDLVVHADWRRRGIGQSLLAFAETRARELDCCKVTLEVLTGNRTALASYAMAGFAPYVLDPAAGEAVLMQKYLD